MKDPQLEAQSAISPILQLEDLLLRQRLGFITVTLTISSNLRKSGTTGLRSPEAYRYKHQLSILILLASTSQLASSISAIRLVDAVWPTKKSSKQGQQMLISETKGCTKKYIYLVHKR